MDYPFTTDGCSGGMTWAWRKVVRSDPPWERACVEHDYAYWQGGSKRDRKLADKMLYLRVLNNGHALIGCLMYWAVRIGGHPLLPFPWRWGYGWKYPRGYR
jgi:hypothetical protein